MREYHLYEVKNQTSNLKIAYAIDKKKNLTPLYVFAFIMFGLVMAVMAIEQFAVKNFNNVAVLCLLFGYFVIMAIVFLVQERNQKPYSLIVDATGLHEQSVSFKSKDILWNEVCYINFFPDIVLEGGKTVQAYGAVVISKVAATDEERKRYIKKHWGSISKAKSEDSIILCTGTTQARRIYELIATKAVLFGDATALKRPIDTSDAM